MTTDGLKETQDKPSEKPEETSEKETETFTKEQLDEARTRGKSDGLSESGRLKKAKEASDKIAERAIARLEKFEKDQEDEELRRAEGDEKKISAINERRIRRQAETDLANKSTELEELTEKLRQAEEISGQYTKEQNAREIAARLDVDPKKLVKLSKYTDGSKEAIEELASELPKKGESKSLKPDSSKTIGGKDWKRVQEAYIKNPNDPQNTPRYLEMRAKRKGEI
ncbi:MAG: hypothetical protein KAS32_29160 [Candidatus Peribacteraceae bacterium]|nr:hypothetical protein [Candidatus Peribacteraceae bacterium]